MYPGAMLLMIPRFVFIFLTVVSLVIYYKICLLGYDVKKMGLPIKKGCRHRLISFIGNLHSMLILFIVGMYSYKTTNNRVDYSYYLGPDYKNKMGKKEPSTVIANHVSFLDPIVFSRRIVPSFAAMDSLKKAPLFNILMIAIGSLFIPRGGSREIKDTTLRLIKERQEMIENSNDGYPPLMIFPEGTTSNGKVLF